MSSVRRVILVGVAVGLAFAVVLLLSRLLLGGRPVTFWLENTAGVWLAAAFISGVLVRRPIPGALAGSGALVIALFLYDGVDFVTDPGFSVQLFFRVRPMWAAVSVVAGAGMGLLGGWSASTRTRQWIGVSVVGALLVGEAVALFVGGPPHPAFDTRVGAAQAIVGTGAVLAVARKSRWWQPLAVFIALTILLVVLELATGLITRLVWG